MSKRVDPGTSSLLTLTRAARLAGVNRAELQRRIRRGEIETFEGKVSATELLRLYPQTQLSNDRELARVEQIKAEATPRQPGDTDTRLPNAEVLVARLRAISEVLSNKVVALGALEGLLDELALRIASLAEEAQPPLTNRLHGLLAWLAANREDLETQPGVESESRLLARDTFLRIMAAHIKLIPSGHEFFVEGTESVLEASVRAGLNLSYGCSSGNCGTCKARVVSGEVRKIREHDYVLSEREKRMGYCLACSNTAVTDLVIEAAEAVSVADLPQQEIRASIRRVEHLTPDWAVLHVQTPRTQTLRYMAGQRAELTLEDGSEAELYIASCPCNGRNLQFFVARDPDDRFATAVFERAHHGQLIRVRGPSGTFVLAEDAPEPAVFVAFGSGIAPVKSLIEHAVSIDRIETFHLYWAVARPEDHHQGHWGRALKESLDNFHFTPLVTERAEDVLVTIEADLPDWTELRYYLVGPPAQVTAIQARLNERGVAPEQIRTETLA
ncbi:2-polyprenylphenol hydroxylase-like oxidoreductase [Thioflavicoccus mobilis 8321]|uniref:2-polyprenylphenol hydroxylase-like oxidoreductase n=1 Tax=Thioflavicoccus mobilis 8321 TaxID=765912 RepID=L0GWN3_9GAMM|nr:2Fe-2S iron-sulfur cluster-binding protein [Thioflavicoccus mobilis]AGA91168.1 2-polyprenylphenol hydroxylase-like oxidoreductase [Thioflavicoccus mobilis 8321]